MSASSTSILRKSLNLLLYVQYKFTCMIDTISFISIIITTFKNKKRLIFKFLFSVQRFDIYMQKLQPFTFIQVIITCLLIDHILIEPKSILNLISKPVALNFKASYYAVDLLVFIRLKMIAISMNIFLLDCWIIWHH